VARATSSDTQRRLIEPGSRQFFKELADDNRRRGRRRCDSRAGDDSQPDAVTVCSSSTRTLTKTAVDENSLIVVKHSRRFLVGVLYKDIY